MAVKLVEDGWFQQKLADSAYETFRKIDSGENPPAVAPLMMNRPISSGLMP